MSGHYGFLSEKWGARESMDVRQNWAGTTFGKAFNVSEPQFPQLEMQVRVC